MARSDRFGVGLDHDVVVVGSGFGGSVAALRLVERGYRVLVVERGKRLGANDFAVTNWNLRRYLWMPRIGLTGPQELAFVGRRLLALVGSGVGGGSLVYAGVLTRPDDGFFTRGPWADLADWQGELEPHYARAARVLGAAPPPSSAGFEAAFARAAGDLGRGARTPEVGVYFGRGARGETVDDPYFDGEGPPRTSCTLCGGCLVGCRYGAKNTLDKNYLHLAEARGAQILPEREVVRLRPLDGEDGRDGYELVVRRSTAIVSRATERITTRAVVLAAGTLGTNRLLLRCRADGTLPHLSSTLGEGVCSNNEELLFVRAPAEEDAPGVAAQASASLDGGTNVLMARFPSGSSVMAPMAAPHPLGTSHPGVLGALLRVLRHPVVATRTLWLRRWAETTRALIVMQERDGPASRLSRGSLGGLRLDRTPPLRIAEGHRFAEAMAERLGGVAQPFLTNAWLRMAATAHVFGGCLLAGSEDEGVVDVDHRVFGYRNLLICDGSTIGSNVGTAPSLTIAAMAERAMARFAEA